MRIAFLADVHSNLEALSACLADGERRGAERVVFLGDLVGYGADPRAVLDRVIGLVAERGNHEVAVTGSPRPEMSDDARTSLLWTRSVLPREHLEFLEKLPLAVE